MHGFALDRGTLAIRADATISEIINKVSEDSMQVTNLAQWVPHLEKLQVRLGVS
jgi:hypothetical protein